MRPVPPGLLQQGPDQRPYSPCQDIWRHQGRGTWQRRHSPDDSGPRKVVWLAGLSLSLINNVYIKSRSRNSRPAVDAAPWWAAWGWAAWRGLVREVKESVNRWRAGPGRLPSSSGRPGTFSSLFYILCAEWVAPLIKGRNGLFSMSTHFIRFKGSKGRTHGENYVFLPSSPHEWAHLPVPFTRGNICIRYLSLCW